MKQELLMLGVLFGWFAICWITVITTAEMVHKTIA